MRLIIRSLFLTICLISFAAISHAEENQDLSTHLPFSYYTDQPATAPLISLGAVATPTLTDITPPTDVWQRIRRGFAIPELNTPLIAKHEQWYISRPAYVARMMDRSRRYLFYIVEEVERRKICLLYTSPSPRD